MALAILDTPSSAVNSIEICTSNKNQTEIPIDDLYDGIKVLVRYIITKNKGRENMKKTTTKDWEIKTLEEVCEFISRGISPKYTESQGLVVVNQKCIRNHVVNLELTRLHDNNLKAVSSEKFIKNGDVLINSTGTGTLGRVAQVTEDIKATVDSHVTIVRPNTEIFDKRFFAWVLFSLEKEIEESGAGASGQTELSRDTVRNFIVLYPKDKKEQKRIVKILDEKFGVIEELQNITKKQIADVKELFESRLGEVFSSPDASWHEVVFCDVCKITSKLIDPKEKKYENLVHVGAGNIIAETGELVNLKTAKEEKLISGKFIFDTEMVLYSKIRPYLMKTVRPDFSGLCSADIYPLKPKDDVLIRDFLYYLLFSKQFTEYAIKGSARAGMPKVNREHMFAYSFFLPGIKKQKQLVKELDELSKKTKELEATFLRKTADLEELKKSYLADAFAGKL